MPIRGRQNKRESLLGDRKTRGGRATGQASDVITAILLLRLIF